jgi:hypothetical protein
MLIHIKKIDDLPDICTIYEVNQYLTSNHRTALEFAVYLNFNSIRAMTCSTSNSWWQADFIIQKTKPNRIIISDSDFTNKELHEEIKTLTDKQLIDINLYYMLGGLSLREYALKVCG